jgi:hypothetical protein
MNTVTLATQYVSQVRIWITLAWLVVLLFVFTGLQYLKNIFIYLFVTLYDLIVQRNAARV